MKNISLILNIVLIVAVGYLYFNEFTGSEEESKSTTNSAVYQGNLAYVNTDSLLAHYHYYDEVEKALEEKRSKLQAQYVRRAETLQKQIEDFQRTYTNMTVPQARAVEEDLMQKRQNLGQFQESITQELMQEEAEITQNLYENITKYLKNYGEENNIQLVFTFTPGSGLLYANEALDITAQVIDALNADFNLQNATTATDSIN